MGSLSKGRSLGLDLIGAIQIAFALIILRPDAESMYTYLRKSTLLLLSNAASN
jgi:hypothetical protein